MSRGALRRCYFSRSFSRSSITLPSHHAIIARRVTMPVNWTKITITSMKVTFSNSSSYLVWPTPLSLHRVRKLELSCEARRRNGLVGLFLARFGYTQEENRQGQVEEWVYGCVAVMPNKVAKSDSKETAADKDVDKEEDFHSVLVLGLDHFLLLHYVRS